MRSQLIGTYRQCAAGSDVDDLLDANYRRQGRSGSFGQVGRSSWSRLVLSSPMRLLHFCAARSVDAEVETGPKLTAQHAVSLYASVMRALPPSWAAVERAATLAGPDATVREISALAGGTHARTYQIHMSNPDLEVILREFPVGDAAARHEAQVLAALDGLDGLAPRLLASGPGSAAAGAIESHLAPSLCSQHHSCPAVGLRRPARRNTRPHPRDIPGPPGRIPARARRARRVLRGTQRPSRQPGRGQPGTPDEHAERADAP